MAEWVWLSTGHFAAGAVSSDVIVVSSVLMGCSPLNLWVMLQCSRGCRGRGRGRGRGCGHIPSTGSCRLASGADAQADDLGIVDREAVSISGIEAWFGPHGTRDIDGDAARPTDKRVVIVELA
jgi:hypothetical protein